MHRKGLTPAVMSLILLLGIIILEIARIRRMPGLWSDSPVNADTLFVGLYIPWLLLETPIAKRDIDTEDKRTADFAACQLYTFAQALTFLTALSFPSVWQAPDFAHLAGIGLLLGSVCYRLWAIRTLGVFYSHRVRTLTHHRIVDCGPYRFSRHPAYAGVCLYFLNWVTLGVFLFTLVPSILLRMVMEERVLFGIEGYADFAKERKRLFPGIW